MMTIIMNIFIVCLFGNHIIDAVHNSHEKLVVSNHLQHSIQNYSHQYNMNISSNVNEHPFKTKSIFLNILMNENHSSNEKKYKIIFRSVLLNYNFSLIHYLSLKWHIEVSLNHCEYSHKDERIINIRNKELEKSKPHDKASKNETIIISKYSINNATNKLSNENMLKKGEIKQTKVYSKLQTDKQRNWESSTKLPKQAQTMNSKRLLVENMLNLFENKYYKALGKGVLNKNEREISYSDILKTLMPRTVDKRSLPSTSTRQLEEPTSEEKFPFSTAGSSLYGSYAYAHSRPSGFGIFPPFGEGEGGIPIEGGEEGDLLTQTREGERK